MATLKHINSKNADCGHVMYQQRYQNKNRKQDCYICGSYKKRTRDLNCTPKLGRDK